MSYLKKKEMIIDKKEKKERSRNERKRDTESPFNYLV